jgi:hypothetical protein
VLATGAFDPLNPVSPKVAATGPIDPGTYRVRVRHDSGARLGDYTLQVYSKLVFKVDALQPWTVGRPYDASAGADGGVPPYQLTVVQPFELPPGLTLESSTLRVKGQPNRAGYFDFVLSVRDSANSLASKPMSFQAHDEFRLALDEFLAFPLNKAVDRVGEHTGGTDPLTFTTLAGALPHGVEFAPGEMRYVGTPDEPGSSLFRLQGVDVAGSASTDETTSVVCAPFGTTPLAAGSAACGYFFDGVAGTSVTISVKTAAKNPVRGLRGHVLGVNGADPVKATIRAGKGSAKVSGLKLPTTGRYYVVLASDSGAASELVGSGKITPPKSGGGKDPVFKPDEEFAAPVGALEGAQLTFKATPSKGSGLELQAKYLLDPDGKIVTFKPGEVSESKNGSFTCTTTLGKSGTWKFVIRGKPGSQGAMSYSFKLKQPAGVVFSID